MNTPFFHAIFCFFTLNLITNASEKAFFDPNDPAAFEANFGTLGYGIKERVQSNSWMSYSFGINYLSFKDGFKDGSVNIEQDVSNFNIPLHFHFHPMENGIYLTAGLNLQNYQADGNMPITPSGTYEKTSLGSSGNTLSSFHSGNTYQFSNSGVGYNALLFDRIETHAEYKSPIAPYFAVGTQGKFGKSPWGYSAEIGVLFRMGASAEVQPSYSIDGIDFFSEANSGVNSKIITKIQNSISDQERRIEDDLKQSAILPVFQIGINYTF